MVDDCSDGGFVILISGGLVGLGVFHEGASQGGSSSLGGEVR